MRSKASRDREIVATRFRDNKLLAFTIEELETDVSSSALT
jgi:hypothetical protein